MELIRRKDAMDATVKKMKLTMRKVEHENADLRFLNTQYAHKLRVQEKVQGTVSTGLLRCHCRPNVCARFMCWCVFVVTGAHVCCYIGAAACVLREFLLMSCLCNAQDGEIKGERIQRLLEKNLKAVVETADGTKQHIATRRQRMEISTFAEPAPMPSQHVKQLSVHEADLLGIADKKIELLEGDAAKTKEERYLIDNQLSTLQAQVQQRENEIERLGRLLEGGRPIKSVLADSHSVKEERKLAQLTNQVEYLQQTNKSLEDELVTTTTGNDDLSLKVEELQSKHSAMLRELANFDRLARELQQEKLSAKADGQRELRKEKASLARQNAALADKLSSARVALNENAKLQGESQHMVASLGRSEREIERLQTELDHASDNNQRLEVIYYSLGYCIASCS